MSLALPETGTCQECYRDVERADFEWIDREDGSMIALCVECRREA